MKEESCDGFRCLIISRLILYFNIVIRPEAGRLYATIPRLSMEWSLKYQIKLLDIPFKNTYTNAFQFTTGHRFSRFPSLTIFNNRRIEIDNKEGTNFDLRYMTNTVNTFYMEVNKTHCFEQNQKYIGGGQYLYNIVIDGVEECQRSILTPNNITMSNFTWVWLMERVLQWRLPILSTPISSNYIMT